jgi:hypothetical protein
MAVKHSCRCEAAPAFFAEDAAPTPNGALALTRRAGCVALTRERIRRPDKRLSRKNFGLLLKAAVLAKN